MAARVLLYLSEASNKRIITTVQHSNTRMQVHSSWRQIRGFKRHRDVTKEAETAFADTALGAGAPSTAKLWKPLVFTIAFSGATVVGASIWEYERIRGYTYRVMDPHQSSVQWKLNRPGWRSDAEKFWAGLSSGQRVFAPICFLNVLVFLAWRVPALKNTMLRYFCANPSSGATCWPMLFSTFSHFSVLHLAANMYVLHSFSAIAVASLGTEQFVAFYLTSGVVSSLGSHIYKTAFGMRGLSLGASGAVMGIVSLVCTHYPDTLISLAFLPMWPFTASSGIKALLAVDTLGCIFGWRFVDHAAHMGGALFGIFWQKWGNANVWQKRKPIVKFWHNLRNPRRPN